MNFRKLVSSLSLVLILYSIIELAFANAEEKRKVPGKGVHGPSSSVPQSGLLKEVSEGLPVDTQQVLEEIRLVSNSLEKKTSVNRNLLIGTAVTNIALLLVVSGLLGFSLKKKDKGDKEDGGKSGKNDEDQS